MRLTKFTQSCVRLEDGGNVLVVDPGIFSEPEIALQDADAVLITHEDPDHADLDAVRAAFRRNPSLRVWAPSSVAEELTDLDGQVAAAAPGQSFEVAGFRVETLGGQHGLIHSSIPVVANIGYIINDAVYHPGDSFVVPEKPVETLLVPIDAPWARMADVMDFVASVRAEQAFPIHEYLLSAFGLSFVEKHVAAFGSGYGTQFHHLADRESLTL